MKCTLKFPPGACLGGFELPLALVLLLMQQHPHARPISCAAAALV